jgi:hypothetical protein
MKRQIKRPIALIHEIRSKIPPRGSYVVDLQEGDTKQDVSYPVSRKSRRKARVERRHEIAPTICERANQKDEIQFMKAMDQYKRDKRRPFPTWSEAMEVLVASGYRRVAAPTPLPGLPTAVPPKGKT